MSAESTVRNGQRPGFQLIETLRWERNHGFLRGDLHLARLRHSASELGFRFNEDTARNALETAIASHDDDMLRVRLSLDADGVASCITAPFSPLPRDTVWRLKIAGTRLQSDNMLLRHKTTLRHAYEQARAEFPPSQADEVLLLNERGEVCEGTITSLFLDMGDGGPLRTPAFGCGLLAGVFRGLLLDEGKAVETVLFPADLERAKAIYVANSLRGIIAGRLNCVCAPLL